MEWISESELVIGNKVYTITNPEWIKNLIKNIEQEKYDGQSNKETD